ncbi:hypothetical protein MYK68_05240 [Gordonia sp. PP30]|uniref:hypothetical protein n=1 Tax=unclassified Gordonia (in: high G+C Gram-positive bacteria) TaxID=2657482 RepID=UPI001FFE5A28|nr:MULTISPECIES: hypothetical protein [unclassified Gordonia (in: high G+C Gram-positive bacteria)]UQE76003.1 hypothetical protein MYK68_05240 [Gordonia sp. PP30]
MIVRSERKSPRRALALLAVMVAAAGLTACSSNDDGKPAATEIVYVTAGASSSTPAASSAPVPTQKGAAGLRTSYAALAKTLGQPVGVSIVPVGGGAPIDLGDQTAQVAWSTIKVPLAIAAQRKNGVLAAETPAIVNSDNDAAESLWSSLGTDAQAAAAVTAVLREGGDTSTTVPSVRRRGEFTIFGQTVWALPAAATFAAHLPCLPDSKHVVTLMGQVAGNQQWGIEVIPGRSTAVKGGWGPSLDGGYVVRQLGLLTRKDGTQVAFALSTHAPGASMNSGIAALNQVGTWIGAHLAAMPGGRC